MFLCTLTLRIGMFVVFSSVYIMLMKQKKFNSGMQKLTSVSHPKLLGATLGRGIRVTNTNKHKTQYNRLCTTHDRDTEFQAQTSELAIDG
jgi:hypothetical protein